MSVCSFELFYARVTSVSPYPCLPLCSCTCLTFVVRGLVTPCLRILELPPTSTHVPHAVRAQTQGPRTTQGTRVQPWAPHAVRELDAHSHRPCGPQTRCSIKQSTASPTLAYGLRPSGDSMTHNHVAPHVAGIDALIILIFPSRSGPALHSLQ